MKPVVKQKLSTLQDIINNAQSGGGGADSYTKAEADAKFETKTNAASTYLSKTDAASTYLSKTDAARMAHKVVAESTAVTESNITLVRFTINNINSLSDLDGGILIITCIDGLDIFTFDIFVYISDQQYYFLDSSTATMELYLYLDFNDNTVQITKEGLKASLDGKKYRMTLIY